jgi:hypothetical protein
MSKHPQKMQNIQSEFSDVLKQTKLSAVLREIHPSIISVSLKIKNLF